MKKTLSVITLIAIILTSLTIAPITANATFDRDYGQYDSVDGEWVYIKPVKYEKNEIAIIQYKGDDTDVIIPEKIDGLTVVGMGDFYVDKPGASGFELVSKLFPNSSAVTSVSIPKTLRDFGGFIYEAYEISDYNYDEGSFFLTKYYYEIIIRDNKISPSTSKRSILEYSVDLENPYLSSKDGIIYNKDQTKLILFPAGKKQDIFSVPQSVTELREFAFANTQLKKVENLNTFKELPMALFIHSDIEEFPNIQNVSDIPSHAFAYCEKLTSVDIPLRVDYVFDHAFYYCKNIEEVDFGKIITIGNYAFAQCHSLKEAILPMTCKSIYDYAFSDCKSLNILTLYHVKNIDAYAFNNCSKLKYINEARNSLYVENVTDYVNPYNVLSAETIERYAFNKCTSLEKLDIRDSVEIQKDAFINCTSLSEVHFWFDIPDKIHADAFKNTALVNNHKGGIIYIDKLALRYKKPSKADKSISIWIKKGTMHIASYCLYDIDGLISLYLPSSLEVVEEVNISSCKDLKRVYISGKNTKFNENSCQTKTTKYFIKSNAYTVLDHFANYPYGKYNYTTNWKPDKIKSVKAVGKSKSTVKITWKKQSYVTGYEIYIKTSKNGKWKKVATLKGQSTTSFTKKSLTKNKTYYFRVRAYKTVENTTYYGAYSSTATAKTKSR